MLEYDLKGDLHGEGSIIFNESRDDPRLVAAQQT